MQKMWKTQKRFFLELKKYKMKKLLFFIVICLYSCSDPNVKRNPKVYIENEWGNLEIVVVDSCEYLYGPWGNATVLTHKGNCKNHKR